MVVTVDTGALGVEIGLDHGAKSLVQIVFLRQQLPGLLTFGFGELLKIAAKHGQYSGCHAPHRVKYAALIFAREFFGSEIRLLAIAVEDDVHFRRALTQEPHRTKVVAGELRQRRRRLLLRKLEHGTIRDAQIAQLLRVGQSVLQGSVQTLECVLPCVTPVGNEALENAERAGLFLFAGRCHLDGAGHGRSVEESMLGQKAADLEVGIDAAFETAEEFHDQLFAEDDRGIALLGAHHPRSRFTRHGLADLIELFGVRGRDLSFVAGERALALDGIEQGDNESSVADGVIHHAFCAIVSDTEQSVVWVGSQHLGRSLGCHE